MLELTTVLLDGTVWTSRPLEEQELRQVQQRIDLIGAVHRLVDAVQREQADLIATHFPKLNRCLTGYDLAHIRDDRGRFNLNSILCGSEGTLALIAEAKLNVVPIPKYSALVNVRYGSFDAALRDAQELIRYGAGRPRPSNWWCLQFRRKTTWSGTPSGNTSPKTTDNAPWA